MSKDIDSSFNESILKEDFDPSTLKIPELKTVLAINDIGFKAHDKKGSLVKLVEDNLEGIKKNLEKDGMTGISESAQSSLKVTKKKRDTKKRKSNTPDVLEESLSKPKHAKNAKTVHETLKEEDGSTVKSIPRKRKKKSKEEEGHESDAERSSPVKKSRKTKKKGVKSEVESSNTDLGSPIAKKVTSKTPIKSPHRSLIIDKFESSDDASDDTGKDDSFANFSIKRSPRQKKNQESANSSLSAASPKEHKGLKSRAEFSSILPSTLTDTAEESTPIRKRGRKPKTPQSTEKSVKEEQDHSVTKTATPEFPTLEDVEKLQEEVNRSIVNSETAESEQKQDISITSEKSTENSIREESQDTIEQESSDELRDEDETIQDSSKEKQDRDLQPELSHHYVAPPQTNTLTAGLKSTAASIGSGLLKFGLFMLVMLPIIFGLWYREQRIAVGFCGSEIEIPVLGKHFHHPLINSFEDRLIEWKPHCLPCPNNAICYPNLDLKCKPGFIIDESIFSLHGLVPIPATCVKDSKKQKLVQEVVKKTLELLRTKNAQENCGECEDDLKSGISNEELYEIFYESKKPWINDEEFNALWEQVEIDLKAEPEIIWRQLPTRSGNNTLSRDTDYIDSRDWDSETEGSEGHFQETKFQQGYFRSTSKKYIGLKCQFERQVHSTWDKYQWILIGTASVAILVQVMKRYVSKKLKERERIDKISREVTKRLQQAVTSNSSPNYMSSVQLRDMILSDVSDLQQKNKLWAQTAKKLDSNTNVKSTLMEIHGEIMKCWEWIGVLPGQQQDPAT